MAITLSIGRCTDKPCKSLSIGSTAPPKLLSVLSQPTWTTDLKDRSTRVNAVSPGSIETPGMIELLTSSEAGEQRKRMISSAVPLGRFGTPDEIAKTVAVVFLASDDSSYVRGIDLFDDGGFRTAV
jgi:NAD(P)-dependent dehydrogenase (short-subunit alcohol dehydrogenase family)